MPLGWYNRNYTINDTDTYGCFIVSGASDGYCFAEETGEDLKDSVTITSNVNVAQILSGDNGSSALAFLELGTVSDIEEATGGATSTKKIDSMTLDVDWSKIPTLEEGQTAKSAESDLDCQEEPPVTKTGNGVDYFTCGWAVKASQSHVDLGYIFQGAYDVSKTNDYWVDLHEYTRKNTYTINATDTYAFVIELVASDGYYFADDNGVDLSKIVKGNNVEVIHTHSTFGGSAAVAILKLGTVSEIATKTEGAKPTEHTITATAGENGSISPNGAVKVKAGENQTFTITPNEGYEIDTLTVDGEAVTASTSYTFSKVNDDHTIDVTFKEVHTHTIITDAAVAPTCTEAGKTEGKHCSVCGEIITAQTTVAALGHDWSNDWVVTKPATTITEGKKECTCKRAGCNQKKYEVIPVIGTPVDPNEGKLDKDAEVAPNAPIEEATIDNTKTELLNAPSIFTEAERQAIESGADARVWMEVSRTDESSIPSADKTKISDAATSIMGENPSITYFDADLFKQVGDGAATQLHEPGIEVEVTIKVPETLLNGDNNFEREYKIIRLHTDVATGASLVDILSGTFDKITGEFTFKTDKFSTYAIAYTDKKLVTGVTLTPATATLTQAGKAVQLTATVAPADATDKSVTWSSSNTNVATVDANGKVTAVANGTAVITVTTTDGSKTAQSTITVAIATTQAPSDSTTPSSSASTKKAVSNRIRLNGGMKFSQTGKQLNLAWGKVSGADGYDVYVQYCGKLFNAKSVTTIKNAKTNKLVIKKINGKSIDPKKVYKAYVVAYKMSNGKKVTLAKSITVHVVGSKHATETNVKSIKLSKDSYTLKKGKTVRIKAKSVLVDSKKKRISDNHGKEFRYTTSNVKVATVTKDGKIKAVGTGTCTIYVYAVNGYAKKITVTVK